MLTTLIDPSTAPLRTAPRDETQWAVQAVGSYVVTLDNISTIPPWLSDALCRASTGDSVLRRALYTDSAISVLAFRRVVTLTSIDTGALRGDLGDRLLMLELDDIDPASRRDEAEVVAVFKEMRSRVLGALLDLVSLVVAKLPTVNPTVKPRMADFGRVLAAVDTVIGTDALTTFINQRDEIFADVVSGDAVAMAIKEFVEEEPDGTWEGPLAQLRPLIACRVDPHLAPRTERALSSTLKRCETALKSVGVLVELLGRKGHKKQTTVRLVSERAAQCGAPSPLVSAPAGENAAHAARCEPSPPVLDLQQEERETTSGPTPEPTVAHLPHVSHVSQADANEAEEQPRPLSAVGLDPSCCPSCGAPHPGGSRYMRRCDDCWTAREVVQLVAA
jgi:hypothetical protein